MPHQVDSSPPMLSVRADSQRLQSMETTERAYHQCQRAVNHTEWRQRSSHDNIAHPYAMEISREGILPLVDPVKHIPSISSDVSNLLAQYEDQPHWDIPGKDFHSHKSDHYNAIQTTTVKPGLR